MKRVAGRLEIDLPRILTGAYVLSEISKLPITYKNLTKLEGVLDLQLGEDTRELCIRTDAVAETTAEAAALLLALDAWLRPRMGAATLNTDLAVTMKRLQRPRENDPAYYFKISTNLSLGGY